MAASINTASVSWDVEKEFRLAGDPISLNKSKKTPEISFKVKKHFDKHFDTRNVECQPEIENPHRFPHILPFTCLNK